MFAVDIGLPRIEYALRSATATNKRTPNGRQLWPRRLWKLLLYVTVPLFTSVLWVYYLVRSFNPQLPRCIPTQTLARSLAPSHALTLPSPSPDP